MACNAFCFNAPMIADLAAGGGTMGPGTMDLMRLLDWCVNVPNPNGGTPLRFDTIDATGYYFPPANGATRAYIIQAAETSVNPALLPSDTYLANFKMKAADLGLTISGTAIHNDSVNPPFQAAGVESFKAWCDVANKIGAPIIRIFSGVFPIQIGDPTRDAKRAALYPGFIATLQQIAMAAKAAGVKAALQNHGDFLGTSDEVIQALQDVGMPDWLASDDDTGYFEDGGNPSAASGVMLTPSQQDAKYAAIQKVLPYAINMQVKTSIVPVKHFDPTPTDLPRLFRIIRGGPFRGPVPIEALQVKSNPYDPFKATPQFLSDCLAAIAATAGG
jgi:hypothetical protein